jgi:hypothetical protein
MKEEAERLRRQRELEEKLRREQEGLNNVKNSRANEKVNRVNL